MLTRGVIRMKKVFVWMAMSLAFQIGVLYYLEYYYFNTNVEIWVTEYNEQKWNEISFKIPKAANNIRVSFDASFVAYTLNDKIQIIDIKKGIIVKEFPHSSIEISYYDWLQDRNIIIYSLKETDKEKGSVRVYTYDFKLYNGNSYPKIQNLPVGSQVTNIIFSPVTNVVHVKVAINEKYSKIYSFDVLKQKKMEFKIINDSIIKQTYLSNNVLYQEKDKDIFLNSKDIGETKLVLDDTAILLQVDMQDKIYIGYLNNDKKLYKIHSAMIQNEVLVFLNEIEFNYPIKRDNLYITEDGRVIIDFAEDRYLHDKIKDINIHYKGELLQVLQGKLVTRDGNNINIKKF